MTSFLASLLLIEIENAQELSPREQFWAATKGKDKRHRFFFFFLQEGTLAKRIMKVCKHGEKSDFKSFVSHSYNC